MWGWWYHGNFGIYNSLINYLDENIFIKLENRDMKCYCLWKVKYKVWSFNRTLTRQNILYMNNHSLFNEQKQIHEHLFIEILVRTYFFFCFWLFLTGAGDIGTSSAQGDFRHIKVVFFPKSLVLLVSYEVVWVV